MDKRQLIPTTFDSNHKLKIKKRPSMIKVVTLDNIAEEKLCK